MTQRWMTVCIVAIPTLLSFSGARAFSIISSSSFCKRLGGTGVRRLFMKANNVVLPLDKLEFGFARSSGPGGQNVNKLNTKAEVRFNVPEADWLAPEIRDRLQLYYPNKITKEGDLVVTSQEHRTQAHNKEDCLNKLREMISEASIEPKERNMYVDISEKGKERRKDDKRKRGAIKEGRRKNNHDYD